jgi:hypothetical protein
MMATQPRFGGAVFVFRHGVGFLGGTAIADDSIESNLRKASRPPQSLSAKMTTKKPPADRGS